MVVAALVSPRVHIVLAMAMLSDTGYADKKAMVDFRCWTDNSGIAMYIWSFPRFQRISKGLTKAQASTMAALSTRSS